MRNQYKCVCIAILAIMITSCRGSRIEIERELKKNPAIKSILFVKRVSIDHEFEVGVELANGGRVVVLLDRPSAVIYVMEIGPFTAYCLSLSEWKGKWSSAYHKYIQTFILREVLNKKKENLNGILDTYDEILAFYEAVYNEPPIPGEIGGGIDTWGDEQMLREFAGYITDKYGKYKIYVRRIDDNSGERLPRPTP
jgi:hypothetical protein